MDKSCVRRAGIWRRLTHTAAAVVHYCYCCIITTLAVASVQCDS